MKQMSEEMKDGSSPVTAIGLGAMRSALAYANIVETCKAQGIGVEMIAPMRELIDLRAGATADVFHGLAAIYVGVSVAFGHRMIRWADEHFAHRFAGGPPPKRPPKHGPEHARR